VSIVALLRAVGHVLDKVDARADADVAYVVEQWNALKMTKPKPEMLWEFIESERNSVVKQHEFGFARTIVATKPQRVREVPLSRLTLSRSLEDHFLLSTFRSWNP
jgi:hypothetical protein